MAWSAGGGGGGGGRGSFFPPPSYAPGPVQCFPTTFIALLVTSWQNLGGGFIYNALGPRPKRNVGIRANE
jgi:hypothetical protein